MEWLLCFALFLRCMRVVLSVIIIRESDNGTGKPKTGKNRVGATQTSIAMKKFKVFIILLSVVFITIRSNSQTPSVEGNFISFPSVASYEGYAENESVWGDLRNIAAQSSMVTTLAEEVANSGKDLEDVYPDYPDFLAEVLNLDYIFRIGGYLIKIDMSNERGLMVSSGSNDAYDALVKDSLAFPGMMVLDIDEDFGLDLLEALDSKIISESDYKDYLLSRTCPGAKRKTMKNIEEWNSTGEACDSNTLGKSYGMDNKVVYQKATFYFSLQSKIRSLVRCTFGGSWLFAERYFYVDLKLTGSVKYKKRCGTEVNNNVDLQEDFFGGGNAILDWRPYSGGRSLSHYDFNVDFGIRPAQDRTPNPVPFIPSMHYNIKYGY